jgi:hypothetical protein
MISPSRVNAVQKMAFDGEQTGLSIEQMIQLLNSGMSVVALLDLIVCRLNHPLRHLAGWSDKEGCGVA